MSVTHEPPASLTRRRIEAHFLAQQAVAPDAAIEYAPGPLERPEFERLRRIRLIRTAAPGHFWLDLDRRNATYTPPNWRILALKGGAVALLFAAFWILWTRA